MLPIPGTSSVDHLEENTAAAGIELTDEEFDGAVRAGLTRDDNWPWTMKSSSRSSHRPAVKLAQN